MAQRFIKTMKGQSMFAVLMWAGTISVAITGVSSTIGLNLMGKLEDRISTATTDIGMIKPDVATVKASENAHYEAILQRLDSIDKKLEKIK